MGRHDESSGAVVVGCGKPSTMSAIASIGNLHQLKCETRTSYRHRAPFPIDSSALAIGPIKNPLLYNSELFHPRMVVKHSPGASQEIKQDFPVSLRTTQV